MRKITQVLSVTLALFLTCSNVMAKSAQEKVQVYAHPDVAVLGQGPNRNLHFQSALQETMRYPVLRLWDALGTTSLNQYFSNWDHWMPY